MALTKEQLAERRAGIGGDDAAAICGKHPFKTAYEVALRIKGELEDANLEGVDIIEFGNEMEDVLARFYERKNKVQLAKPQRIVHPQYPFIGGNIDRRIIDNPKTAIECKNVGLFAGEWWGQPGSDEVPERVTIQTHHYMLCDPVIERFHVLRCWGGNVYQMFVIERDQELVESLLTIELDFMEKLNAGELPPPDFAHRSTTDTLKRAFKKIQGTIEARPDLATLTEVYKGAAERLAHYTQLERTLKNEIVYMIGDTEVAILPDGSRWRRKLVNRKGYEVEPSSYIETRLMKPKEGA